ncbi:MAG TPA: HrpE/YscL family type III secretion apparatus protein [Phycisphaerae bacterium]|nr:HrpE/YscL family type III secretion apparatus protein [Phycisphaerae bacterium]
MAETIEAFVARIQSEGVEAGKKQAKKLLSDARKQADEIVQQARTEAEKIIADADEQAKALLDRSRTELHLAARDTVLKLRATLAHAVELVLAGAAAEKLTDVDFLGKILHELVLLYARSDLEHAGVMSFDVPPDIRGKLAGWALREIGQESVDGLRRRINLTGTLAQAGFEYNFTGATVEVTQDSVVAMLKEMVTPRLREILEQAAAETKT